jgi:hypothetical protein
LPVRYPYEFTLPAEDHQSVEALCAIFSRKSGEEVTVPEAIVEAVRRVIAEEIASDGKDGKERKLPSSYRQVIFHCPACQEYSVRTLDGRVNVSPERARELLEGAEVLDLTKNELDPEALPGDEKCPARGIVKTQVVESLDAHKNSDHVASGPGNGPVLVQHAPNLSTPIGPEFPGKSGTVPTPPSSTRKS